jgi:hypothetical protein
LRVLLPLGLFVVLTAYSCSFYEFTRGWEATQEEAPALVSAAGRAVLADIAIASARQLVAPFRMESIERLRLEIEPRHLERIVAKREEALNRRLLITSSDDFVPATLWHRGRAVRARVRLKGDLVDHLQGDKWSFRVEVRDGDAMLGMRRFSLQAPHTREYQAEPIFFDFLREHGILAPRYFFVELTLNNRSIGRMAVEEHFSTELLESQERRDGIIVRFDEQYFYLAELEFLAVVPDYDNWRNVPVDAFRSGRIDESPLLREQMRVAGGLLRGAAEDRLRPSAAFDVDTWGRFLAACEIWFTPHMTHWNNLRFYLNPLTLKLEPIAFDAMDRSLGAPGLRCMGFRHVMMRHLMGDPALRAAFLESLDAMCKEVTSPDFAGWLEAREAEYLPLLKTEFPWLRPLPIEDLQMRAHELGAIDEKTFWQNLVPRPERAMPHRPEADYPMIVQASLQADDAGPYLDLANSISRPVTVTEIWLEVPDRRDPRGAPKRMTQPAYQPLPPTPWPEAPKRSRVPLTWPFPEGHGWRIGGTALVDGRSHSFTAVGGAPPLERAALPQATLVEAREAHPFLRLDEADGWLRIEPGVHEVLRSMVLPEAFGLRVESGTTLRFAPDAILLARGPLAFTGSDGAPIVLEAQSGLWPGIAVLGRDTPIRWSHVVVRQTSSPRIAGWGVTGGVTFLRSDVVLEDCLFEASAAEDALNVVRSSLQMKNVVIRNVASDALDADFCTGTIEGGRIEEARGDGIDISGSQIAIEGVQLRNIRDKAFSVGEGSNAEIRHVEVESCGTGVASKDGSITAVEDARFSRIEHAALMAYVKKRQYGPAALRAERVRTREAARETVAQLGSRLTVDGQAVPAEAVDVDALYESGPMRKRVEEQGASPLR